MEIQVATVNTESIVGIYCLPKRQVHQIWKWDLGKHFPISKTITNIPVLQEKMREACRVRSRDAHLKMLHSGSILRMVGSSTYSYCSS